MKIAIGCDKLGFVLKSEILQKLSDGGHDVIDFGVQLNENIDYPIVGEKVARCVVARQADRGILICGTGIGMAITANKVKGAYAAVCHDIYSTQRSILSNNANIMCLGAGVVGNLVALALVDIWTALTFIDGSSTPKISLIQEIEKGE